MLKMTMAGMMLMLASLQVMAATPFDQAFLRSEAQGSAYELAIARLAQTRATRPDVRAYTPRPWATTMKSMARACATWRNPSKLRCRRA